MVADTTCYTGCTTQTTGITNTPPPAHLTSVPPAVPHSVLAFTGADILEMLVIGVIAVVVGVMLLRAARLRRRA